MKFNERNFMLALADSGMLLKDVAKGAGISVNALYDIRKGNSQPRMSTLGRIAKALNISVKDLIQEEGE